MGSQTANCVTCCVSHAGSEGVKLFHQWGNKDVFDRKCLEKCQNLILLGEDHNYVQNTTNKNKVYLIFEYN